MDIREHLRTGQFTGAGAAPVFEALVSSRDRRRPLVYSRKAWDAARLMNFAWGSPDRLANVVTENGLPAALARTGRVPVSYAGLDSGSGAEASAAAGRIRRAGAPDVGAFFYSLSPVDFMDPFDFSGTHPALERFRRRSSARASEGTAARIRRERELAKGMAAAGFSPFPGVPELRVPKHLFSGLDLSAGGLYEVRREALSLPSPDGTSVSVNLIYASSRKSKSAFVLMASSHMRDVTVVCVPWNRGLSSVTAQGRELCAPDPYSGKASAPPIASYHAALREAKGYLRRLGIPDSGAADPDELTHGFGMTAAEAAAVNALPESAIGVVPSPISRPDLPSPVRAAFNEAAGMMPPAPADAGFPEQAAYAKELLGHFFKGLSDESARRFKEGAAEPPASVHAQDVLMLFHDYTTLARGTGGLMIKDMVMGSNLTTFSPGAVFSAVLSLVMDGTVEASADGTLTPAAPAQALPEGPMATLLFTRQRLIATLRDAGVSPETSRRLVREFTDSAASYLERSGVSPRDRTMRVLALYAPQAGVVWDRETGRALAAGIRAAAGTGTRTPDADIVSLAAQALRGKLRLRL